VGWPHDVSSAIVGASRPEQLDENAAASDARVEPALFAQARQILCEADEVEA
jgi:1-deoxyxylulose-5-phosphate synthase